MLWLPKKVDAFNLGMHRFRSMGEIRSHYVVVEVWAKIWKNNWLHCVLSQWNWSLGIFLFENVNWNVKQRKILRTKEQIDFNFFRKLIIYKHLFCLQYFFLFLKRTVRLLFANILEPEPPPYVPSIQSKAYERYKLYIG